MLLRTPITGCLSAQVALVVFACGAAAQDAAAESEIAEKQNHWAFQPPAARPVPQVRDTSWPRSPLDRFILAKLEAEQLRPAPMAERRALIRRATFDLIGLPPTPEEVEAFLGDDSPDGFARVIERLLASPHYGERWGRHWLDVARYADSNGMDENLAYANAYRYRDYVVAAFNADKPFDQFTGEQLAGDLMPVTGDEAVTHERQIATGFLALGPKMLAEDDPVKMQMDIVDEQIDTVGRAFMGINLGCARCHDHKFDPISMEDYYSLAGIFKSTQTMENFKVVARWFERPLETQEFLKRKSGHAEKLAAKEAQLVAHIKTATAEVLRATRRRVADYLLASSELIRQKMLAANLRPMMNAEQGASPPGSILIEAEDFARGNVRKDFETYGHAIGVLVNRGELPNFVEYEIETPAAGTYQLELRYAAAESRPVELLIDGRLVKADAAREMTGSWTPESQSWGVEGRFTFGEGKTTLRLQREGPFPHIDKLALVPRHSAAAGLVIKTPEQIAVGRELNLAVLGRFADYIERSRGKADSIFSAWHRLDDVVAAATKPIDEGEPQADATLPPVFLDVFTASLRRLAARYQELFDHFETSPDDGKPEQGAEATAALAKADRDALAKVLNDPDGPFVLPEEPDAFFIGDVAATLKQLRGEVKELKQRAPEALLAMGVTEGEVQNVPVHIRGSHVNLGAVMRRRLPSVLAGDRQPAISDEQSGRLQLARWLSEDDHPLVARVIVNRVWRWHFGAGLVRTADNFGTMGDRPVHGGLLDWMSLRFIQGGRSIKDLHRLIMLSSTYQMSTAYDERAAGRDPENRLHWRMNRRRLEAEAIRDAMLTVAGTLETTMGGSLLVTANRAYVAGTASRDPTRYDAHRRSIYLPVVRSALYNVFQAFDFPDPSAMSGDRATTTVAPQALMMLNSQLVDEQSREFAGRLLARDDLDRQERVRLAYEMAYARPPRKDETNRALEFVERYEQALKVREPEEAQTQRRAWQAYCRVLLASSEFVYVD